MQRRVYGGGMQTPVLGARRPRALAGARQAQVPLRFYASSSNIPHPEKQNNGEDACYITECGTSIGVSDGVGGWLEVGVDSGIYSREMCRAAARIVADTGEIDPKKIIKHAYDESTSTGTATFCCLTIHEDKLYAANLGDSKFVLLRPSADKGLRFIMCSQDQQHYFNCPKQLGSNSLDMPDDADSYEATVQAGDIVVAGTDGLFDNISVSEVIQAFEPLGFQLPCDEPTLTKLAAHLATTAFLVSRSHDIDTPFARNARRNNAAYMGGKLDDITVVVAVIAPHFVKPESRDPVSSFVLPRSAFMGMCDDEETENYDDVEETKSERFDSPVSMQSASPTLSSYESYDDSSPRTFASSSPGDAMDDA